MDKKTIIIIVVAALLVLIAAAIIGFLIFLKPTAKTEGQKQAETIKTQTDATSQVQQKANDAIQKATAPAQKLPDVNPATKANPIKNVKTNPFE